MERFALRDVIEVPKMGLRAFKYTHPSSNLTHVHVQKKGDANRVFSLAFKTNAPDKTGVPHILEHTTLCGSNKYPVRDPFFKMLSRSLANFMNAMTGFDYTYYPFATTNKADYANLQKVYMDSVFDPLLKEQDFLQEGWRLEPQDISDEKSPLTFKGVVFNEMKGQMSMPSYYHYISWFMSIYPSMQYSAGDPVHIPELKYEDLVKFHREHYHPGNCFTFSYGDFAAEEALMPLNEYLEKFAGKPLPASTGASVPQPVSLEQSAHRREYGPLDPMFDENRQHKISLTWYVGSPTDLVQTLAWRVLGMLLADGHSSPFYQALIDSGVGPEFSVNTGFEETPGKLMFTIGLQGIEESKIQNFKDVVFDTIEKIKAEGFPQERIDAILHQAEFGDREVDANYGMGLLSRMVGRAFHPNNDFMELIDNEKLIESFKKKLAANPQLFQQELAKYVGREHPYFEFEMAPSPEFEAKRAEAETQVLAQKLAQMSEQEKDVAITKAKELEEATKAPQNLDILPTVTTNDISPEIRKYPVSNQKLKQSNINLVSRETGTQGISYVKLLRDISSLPKNLVPYLLLYTDAHLNVGTKSHSMADLEDLIKLHTGNLSVSSTVRSWGNLELSYSASALDSKLREMYQLLQEIASEPLLNNVQKLKVMVDTNASNITNALSQSGHRYAVSRAGAALSHRKAAEEELSGFSFVKLIQQLSAQSEEQLYESLVPQLMSIHSLPWSLRNVGLTYSPPAATNLQNNVDYLESLTKSFNATAAPAAPTLTDLATPSVRSKIAENWKLSPAKTMVTIPSFQVSHVGAAVKGCDHNLLHKDHAALQVLANLMTHKYLHPEIREKGGAYGGGASYNAIDGLFTMFSYRDPTPVNTQQVVKNAGAWACQTEFSDRDVEEGKIGIFQSVDSPISPRNEISGHLGAKITDEERQIRRENLLKVTAADLRDVADKYIRPHLADDGKHSMCIIGPNEATENWSTISLK